MLGNDRLVSMWPARGHPRGYGDTVYWAAGIWPFMGVFVQAVDIASGKEVWTNSGSGADYLIQQHDSPAFAGIAPQGYLVANERFLLVSGGMTVPAVFDRTTGACLYFRPGDRELGKDVGGYEVLLGPDWFATRGQLHRLADGMPLATAPVDLIAAQTVWGVAGKHVVASQLQIERYDETSVDRQGAEKRTVTHRLPVQFRTRLPEGLTRLHLLVANGLVVSDDGGRIAVLNVPSQEADSLAVQWETRIEGTTWSLLVADERLIAVGLDGTIRCFGAPLAVPAEPLVHADSITASSVVAETPPHVAELLAAMAARSGYAVMDQPGAIGELLPWVGQTQFHVLALMADDAGVLALRKQLRERGLLGTRVAVVRGDLQTAQLPPYLAELIVTDAGRIPAASRESYLAAAFSALRPYSGMAAIGCETQDQPACSAALGHFADECTLTTTASRLMVRRTGPLPGAGSWTQPER